MELLLIIILPVFIAAFIYGLVDGFRHPVHKVNNHGKRLFDVAMFR
jgi:hypothetical protein